MLLQAGRGRSSPTPNEEYLLPPLVETQGVSAGGGLMYERRNFLRSISLNTMRIDCLFVSPRQREVKSIGYLLICIASCLIKGIINV